MSNTTKKRVVVTGLGWVTPLGIELESTWQAILSGKSGIKKIPKLAADGIRTHICGLVSGYDPQDYFSPKDIRKMDPFIQYALVAADQAITHANLPCETVGAETGVAFGSGIGGLSYIEENYRTTIEKGAKRISPFFIPSTIVNMAAGHISIKHGLKGPNLSVVTACTSGTHNIGLAARMIASGDAKVMIAGGSEYASCILGMGGFSAMKALSTRNDEPTKASRPWDKNRDGFVLSDGAGALVLEDYDYAVARGAKIFAEVAGFKMTADAHHITAPDEQGDGAIRTMQGAITDAGISETDIQVINAHGTSTAANDRIENHAVKTTFGAHAYNLRMSSIKSMLGHTLGAAGAIEGVASVLTLRDQIVPPTINCEEPDEGCDLNYVRQGAESLAIEYVMSNSFGFGGTNGSVIFRKMDNG